MSENIIINPIGYVHSNFKYRYETPRQATLCDSGESFIELLPHQNFEQALEKLEGFERIWVIFLFHLNKNWKPMVTPPRHTRKKVGVFATRAPYRPNQIGMSCVKLISVDGLKIHIGESDILDASPVLDIKPYLPYSDSFPDSLTGWVKAGTENAKYSVDFETLAENKMLWLKKEAKINLKNFIKLQLEFMPADDSRKRVEKLNIDDAYLLSYRIWRIHYTVNEILKSVHIGDVTSAYTENDLSSAEDKYEDKHLHREFNLVFGK